jgi:hypothetical protein
MNLSLSLRPRCPHCNRAFGRSTLAAHVAACQGSRPSRTERNKRSKAVRAAVIRAAGEEP